MKKLLILALVSTYGISIHAMDEIKELLAQSAENRARLQEELSKANEYLQQSKANKPRLGSMPMPRNDDESKKKDELLKIQGETATKQKKESSETTKVFDMLKKELSKADKQLQQLKQEEKTRMFASYINSIDNRSIINYDLRAFTQFQYIQLIGRAKALAKQDELAAGSLLAPLILPSTEEHNLKIRSENHISSVTVLEILKHASNVK